MRNFQNTFEIPKRSFISGFSICITVPLNVKERHFSEKRGALILLGRRSSNILRQKGGPNWREAPFRVNTVFPNILLFILAYYVGLSYFSTSLRNFKTIFRRGWDSNPRGQSPMD